MISRRQILQVGSLAAAMRATGFARKLATAGVQLYTVRTVLPQRTAETLQAIDAIGYREAEATFDGFEKILPALTATHLKPVSMHLDMNLLLDGNDDELARTLANVKRMGFNYAVAPYLAPAKRGGLDVIRKLAEKLNRAGAKSREAGLSFCYHNHAFEFEPMEGTTPFQVMVDDTDKKTVGFEMDAFWVSVAGHDPAEMLAKLKGRVKLMHLKDKASGTPVMYKESVPKTAFQEVGSGILDWKRILRAAAANGVEHYFVEQDQTPGDPVESLRKSFTFISNLEY
jgi:sugar phosphate isomerase/epimerase